jgi:hypothetical protein
MAYALYKTQSKFTYYRINELELEHGLNWPIDDDRVDMDELELVAEGETPLVLMADFMETFNENNELLDSGRDFLVLRATEKTEEANTISKGELRELII